jgi:hypothetical protein
LEPPALAERGKQVAFAGTGELCRSFSGVYAPRWPVLVGLGLRPAEGIEPAAFQAMSGRGIDPGRIA